MAAGTGKEDKFVNNDYDEIDDKVCARDSDEDDDEATQIIDTEGRRGGNGIAGDEGGGVIESAKPEGDLTSINSRHPSTHRNVPFVNIYY